MKEPHFGASPDPLYVSSIYFNGNERRKWYTNRRHSIGIFHSPREGNCRGATSTPTAFWTNVRYFEQLFVDCYDSMVVRSLSTTLWKSADPRLRVFVTFSSAVQAAEAIQTGQVQVQARILSISCLSPTDSSVLIRLQQSTQMPPMPQQLPTPVTPATHSPVSTFPDIPSSHSDPSPIPLPTAFSESVLTTPRRDSLGIPLLPSCLWPQSPFVSSNPSPVYQHAAQASANSFAILDPREPAAKRLQQGLDDIKQRYEQIQEEKDVLDVKNTGLLAQYNQAIAERSRADHELLSVRSENQSLSEERDNLQRRLRDAYGKCKNLEQHQKERDKRWHTRCESIKEEWQRAILSLKTELKEMTLQRDEARHRLQKCQNDLEDALEALGKEVVKREGQEIEIQVLRSREVVEPEFLKALRAIEGLANKGTVKLERLPDVLSRSSASYVKKEEVDTLEQMGNGGEHKGVFA